MKRFSLFSLASLLLSWLIFLPPAFSQSNTTETLTISTYYPSPYGVYNELRLYPKTSPSTCDSLTEGNMYYNSTTDQVMVCRDPSGWQSMSGLWTLSGTNLYPNNPAWNVGIGTTSPAAEKLVVTGRAHFSDVIKSGNLSVANSIMSGVGMTDAGGFAVGFANGSGVLIAKNAALSIPGVGIAGPGGVPAIGMSGNTVMGYLEAYLGKDLQLKTATINSVIYMKNSNGNVGIGTTNPQAKLHVLAPGVNGIMLQGVLGVGDPGWTRVSSAIGADQGGLIELGAIGPSVDPRWYSINPISGGTPYIDMHYGNGLAQDYNVRIINSGNNMLSLATISNGNVLTVNGAKVGIGSGMMWPWASLDVSGSTVNIPGFRTMNSAYNRYIFMVPELGTGGYNWLSQAGDSGIFFSNLGAGLVIGPWAGGNYGIRMTASGNVGIGTTPLSGATGSLTQRLRTGNSLSFSGWYNSGGPGQPYLEFNIDNVALFGISVWPSSKKNKTDIADIEVNTENIYNLSPVSFYYKDQKDKTLKNFGLIAEEAEKFFPQLVLRSSENNEIIGFDYARLSVLVLNEVKKLKKEIESLKAQIEKLEEKGADLKTPR